MALCASILAGTSYCSSSSILVASTHCSYNAIARSADGKNTFPATALEERAKVKKQKQCFQPTREAIRKSNFLH